MSQLKALLILVLFGLLSCDKENTGTRTVSNELEDEEVSIKATYVAWGCACANWMMEDDINEMNRITGNGGSYDCEKLGTCFNIEPATPDVAIADKYWTDQYSSRTFVFKGRFYKEKQAYPGHDDIVLFAKKFKYTSCQHVQIE